MSASDNSNASNSGSPLFQGLDEKERIYAPEQVPNAVHAPNELDAGGTAGTSTASAAHEAGAGRANIAGADGNAGTVPIVGVRPDVSANAPIVGLPATTDENKIDNSSER